MQSKQIQKKSTSQTNNNQKNSNTQNQNQGQGQGQGKGDDNNLKKKQTFDDNELSQPALYFENKQLQDLSFLHGKLLEGLVYIDLHKNFLSSIDILDEFRNLKTIKASDNYISEVNLNLPKLEKLYLQNNYIFKFPILHHLPKIVELNLNANKISDFRIEFKHASCNSMQFLDIGNNQLVFNTIPEKFNFLEKIKKLKNLKTFIISNNNPPIDDNILEQIVSSLPELETLNNEKVDELKIQQANQNENKDLSTKNEEQKKTKGKPQIDKNNFEFPTLQVLCYHLEAANSHPSYSLDHLKDLALKVERISNQLDLIDEYFGKGKNEVEMNEMIETFMQNAQLLIDNHYELQSIMLSILAKLSIIKYFDFGIRCFNTLKDLMIAGKDMEDKVITVLKKEVINKLQQQDPETLSPSLLKGLHELVEKTEKSEMLVGLYENCFPVWFKSLNDKINICRKIAIIYENNDHFDAIIALMAVSVKDKENSKKAVEKDIISNIAEILNETTWQQARYIDLLKIAEYISINSPIAAKQFIDKFVHINLMKNIRIAMYVYKKNNDLKEEDSKETDEMIKLKYLTLAAEIDCLGALLEAEKQKREGIIKDQLLDDMLQIASHYKTDPVLLTSICKFAKQFFSRDEIRTDQKLLEPKINKMSHLKQLTPYLGMKKYDDLLKMSRKYYQSSSFADKEKSTQLQHLDDIIVQKLFISIINLINFFCEESKKSSACQIFSDVSKSLNDAGREQALFNCLAVPNDEVKLAVVECLNNVPLSEFETEEIQTIIKLLSSYKNIGAGKTELVLSKIFWILSKLTKDKDEQSGKNFRMKYGEKAIKEALDILIKNQQRYVEGNEEQNEKLVLSLSCVHFLKFASANSELKRFMLFKNEQLKMALYADEMNTSHEYTQYPIEIEETWIGRSIDTLMYCITGIDTISPYNFVSFRVIQRIADILMNRVDHEVMDPFQQEDIDVFTNLKKHYQEKLVSRIAQENTYWDDIPEDFLNKLSKNQNKYNIYKEQHQQFTQNNGIPILRMFLTKKIPAYEQYLNNIYNQVYDIQKLKLKVNLIEKKDNFENKERQKQKLQKEKEQSKSKKQEKAIKQQEEEKGLETLRIALQGEEIGQNYDLSKSQDPLLQIPKQESINNENIKKRDFKDGVQDLQMRSLCIASYLRCLFASIEYAPDQGLRDRSLEHLKDRYVLSQITQLCDTTGWFDANIGAKYLRIVRQIIKMPYKEAFESIDRLNHYEIICLVINKILNQVLIKIKNEQQKPLTNEDKILIYELANTCKVICQQCSMFQWSSLEIPQQQHGKIRRTPQEKILDQLVAFLFPSISIQTFIAIIFRDMHVSKQLQNKEKINEDEEERKYIMMKSEQAREYIKLFIGEYLSKCKNNKYDVLEAIMKGKVYEKKYLRDSFLQEILTFQQNASYKMAIEKYIYNKKLGFKSEEKERILYIEWVEISYDKSYYFKQKLLIFTNKGIHILKPPFQKPCKECPPQNLCPDGPRTDIKFEYVKIIELITFQDFPQKLVLIVQLNSGLIKKNYLSKYELSIIIPHQTIAKLMITQLQQIMKDIGNNNMTQDMFAYGSIMNYVGAEEEIYFANYITYIPQRGFFSLGEQQIRLLLVMDGTKLLLLKENWNKWYFMDDYDKIKKIIQSRQQETKTSTTTQKRQIDEKLKYDLENVFTLELVLDISNIIIDTYRGKDLILDICIDTHVKEKKDKKDASDIKYQIVFLSDIAREQFQEVFSEIKSGNVKKLKKKDQETLFEDYF